MIGDGQSPAFVRQHKADFDMFGRKNGQKLAPAETRTCSHDATLNALTAEVRTLTAGIESLERAFRALDALRIAFEAKSWMAFQSRLAGRVKAGCARAASARRDAHGRYLPN